VLAHRGGPFRVASQGSRAHIVAGLSPIVNGAWYAQHLDSHGELTATAELLKQLDQISVSTVARRLARIRQGQFIPPRRKRAKRTSSLLQSIPMRRISWDIGEPGHFEIDLVLHCGPSSSGEHTSSLQMIDVLTAWSERDASTDDPGSAMTTLVGIAAGIGSNLVADLVERLRRSARCERGVEAGRGGCRNPRGTGHRAPENAMQLQSPSPNIVVYW
jgi:hypothetical protein